MEYTTLNYRIIELVLQSALCTSPMRYLVQPQWQYTGWVSVPCLYSLFLWTLLWRRIHYPKIL